MFSSKVSRSLTSGVVVIVLMNHASHVMAGVVVDQSFLGQNPAVDFALAEGYAYVGQTVTTGITGDLVAVELNVARRSDFLIPWVVDIQQVVAGAPTGTILSSTTIAPENFPLVNVLPSSAPLSLTVAMNVGIPFHAGDQFAIALHPEGITGMPGLNAGDWDGSDGYAGGTSVVGTDAKSLSPYSNDANFRTHVYVTPEPATLALAVMGVLGLVMFPRKIGRQHNPGANAGEQFSREGN